jgi:hypothetical protein
VPLVSVTSNKVGGGLYTREPLTITVADRTYTFSWNKDDTTFVETHDMAHVTTQVTALSGGTVVTRPE